MDFESDIPRVIDMDLSKVIRSDDTALDNVMRRIIDDVKFNKGELYSAHSTSPRTGD